MNVTAASYWQGDDARAALKQLLPAPPRRAGHFAELALLGAVQCASALALPRDTAIVLASRNGNRRQAEDLARTVALERAAPMPFAFIASQSGAACQVIAQHLHLNGTALCVSSSRAPFEHALALSVALLAQDDAPVVLAGWVEESEDGDGGVSHWLCLHARASADGADLQISFIVAADEARAFGADDDVVDRDTEAAAAPAKPPAPDESEMARRLLAAWSNRRDYRRLRALDDGRYLALTLKR